jgi:hypothetical protein
MVRITLYTPNGDAVNFDAENYHVEGAVLRFRDTGSASLPQATDITTTVPFLIKEIVDNR